jgi:hypothetical protein
MIKTVIATCASILICSPALAANGTIKVEPFLAYYGEGSPVISGAKMDKAIQLPNHLGDVDTAVGPALQKLCGPGASVYYKSVGQSGGGGHGYNVFSGVCITVQ